MSGKKDDLEAIVDLLHEWAVRHEELFVTMTVRHEADNNYGHAWTWTPTGEGEITIHKKYETPAVRAAGESR